MSKPPMRVLFVSPSGGATMSSATPVHYALECARRGMDVTMFGAGRSEQLEGVVNVIDIGEAWTSFRSRLRHLRRAIAEIRPDVVHVFWHPACELYPLLTRGSDATVWIADARSPIVLGGLRGLIRGVPAWFTPWCYDQLASPTEMIGRKLFHRSGIAALPLGFDATCFSPRDSAPRAGKDGNLRIVYIGSLSRLRGTGDALAALVRAVAELPRNGRLQPMIDVYGQGDGESQISDLGAATPNLIRLHGYMPRAILADRLRDYDVGLAIIPGAVFRHSPALKTLEYLASGLPVIANDSPGNRLYVEEGRNGWLVGEDPRELANLVVRLCRTGIPEGMSRRAADSVRGHAWPEIVDRYLLPLYESRLQSKRERPRAIRPALAWSIQEQRSPMRALAYRGIAAVGAMTSRRPHYAVLCFHRLRLDGVLPAAADPSLARAMPIGSFARHMKWLSTFADIATLDEVAIRARKDPYPDRWTVAVTFDDGFSDNLDLGLPVMRPYGIRPTIFLTTGFIADHDRIPWWILLDRVISSTPDRAARMAGTGDVLAARSALAARCYRAGPSELRRYEAELSDALAIAGAQWSSPFLTPEQVADTAAKGDVLFGAHTDSHVSLPRCSDLDLDAEVTVSRDRVAAWTGTAPRWFAFPYGGRGHVDDRSAAAIRHAGFKGAVTLSLGYPTGDVDPWRWPRIPIAALDGPHAFRARVLAAPLMQAVRNVTVVT